METLIEEDFLAARGRSGHLSSACRCKTRSKGNELDLQEIDIGPVHSVQVTYSKDQANKLQTYIQHRA